MVKITTTAILYFIILSSRDPQGNTRVYNCITDRGSKGVYFTQREYEKGDTVWPIEKNENKNKKNHDTSKCKMSPVRCNNE